MSGTKMRALQRRSQTATGRMMMLECGALLGVKHSSLCFRSDKSHAMLPANYDMWRKGERLIVSPASSF
jgi:hypothetical protein